MSLLLLLPELRRLANVLGLTVGKVLVTAPIAAALPVVQAAPGP